MTTGLWDRETFVEKLRAIGVRGYHDKHPFHVAMNEGRLSPEALRGWVANRFYYQRNIPIKDAAILANCPVREVRRSWIHRILDHDGVMPKAMEGGAPRDAEAGRARRRQRRSTTKAASKRGCDLVKRAGYRVTSYWIIAICCPECGLPWMHTSISRAAQPWPIAIASSLTELFAPDLMTARLAAFEKFYRWIDPRGLDYFRRRVTQARRDSDEALAITLEYCNTPELQREAVRALEFKCDVLWSMLDAIHHAYFKEGRSLVRPSAGNFGDREIAAPV